MKKILLADRDETLKNSFRLVFPKEEYQIIHAANGKDALNIASKEKPDIFIVNVNLPDMKGQEALKALEHGGYLKEKKIYLLRDEGVQEDLSDYKVDGVIDKPINYLAVHELLIESNSETEILTKKKKDRVTELFLDFSTPEIQERFFALKEQIETIVKDAIGGAQRKIIEKIEPLIQGYIEWYVERKLPEVAEKVLKQKIDEMITLLKK